MAQYFHLMTGRGCPWLLQGKHKVKLGKEDE